MPSQTTSAGTVLERMTAKTEFGDCWEFMGARLPLGYGRIWTGRRTKNGSPIGEGPHRIIMKELFGEIPDGMHVDHLCKNPPCWNPDHLEVVTEQENLRRSRRKIHRYVRPDFCKNGHDLTGHNWSPPNPNSRSKYRCKVCHRERVAAYKAAQGR